MRYLGAAVIFLLSLLIIGLLYFGWPWSGMVLLLAGGAFLNHRLRGRWIWLGRTGLMVGIALSVVLLVRYYSPSTGGGSDTIRFRGFGTVTARVSHEWSEEVVVPPGVQVAFGSPVIHEVKDQKGRIFSFEPKEGGCKDFKWIETPLEKFRLRLSDKEQADAAEVSMTFSPYMAGGPCGKGG